MNFKKFKIILFPLPVSFVYQWNSSSGPFAHIFREVRAHIQFLPTLHVVVYCDLQENIPEIIGGGEWLRRDICGMELKGYKKKLKETIFIEHIWFSLKVL